MKNFKRAKRHKDRIASKSTMIEQSYYKLFVLYSIILLIGIFLPQYLGVYYLEYSFLYIIVLPICLIVGIYLKFIKKVKGGGGNFLPKSLGDFLHSVFILYECKCYVCL